MKIYVDQALLSQVGAQVEAALSPLRALLCDRLSVTPSACQIAVIAVRGLSDQPRVNVELRILPRPDRTPDRVKAVCGEVQAAISAAAGTHAAVRCSQLDPETYVALE